ncbi:MAG: hypothetical protein ACXW3Z_05095 [Limisphaerales bacterium]
MKTIILSKAGLGNGCRGAEVRGAILTAPSARVPVTAANREYLRSVRQAELELWRNARGGTTCRQAR